MNFHIKEMIEQVDRFLASTLSNGVKNIFITPNNQAFTYYQDAFDRCKSEKIDSENIKKIPVTYWPEYKSNMCGEEKPTEKEFDPRAEADNIILRIGSQQRAVADFFRKTPYTGVDEVYTNLDEQGLYLSKEDAVRNSGANPQGHKAFITWRRK